MSIRRISAIVVTAMAEEAQPFLDALPHQPLEIPGVPEAWMLSIPVSCEDPAAEELARPVLLVRCGIGLVAASSALAAALAHYSPRLVISAGTAGGLARGVAVGDVCLATDLAYTDVDATAFGYAPGQTPGQPARFAADEQLLAALTEAAHILPTATATSANARLHTRLMLSGGSFVTASTVDEVRERFPEAISTDMESTALAQVSYAAGLPFASVRGISDLCGPEAGEDFHMGADEAAARSAALVIETLAHA